MRALVTGIGGSIGCHVFAHIMHKTSWDVVGIESFRHRGMSDRITHMFEEHPEWQKRLTMITHDLVAPISYVMRQKIGPIDYVFNLASFSDVYESIANPRPFVENNVALQLTMLDYAREAKPVAFLQVSSDEVYGPTDGKHLHNEWDPIVPSNPYSGSKAAQEAIAISYWRAYNVPLIIINMMNNFGEMQSPAKFPAIVQHKIMRREEVTVHGSPAQQGSRFYLHSRNAADAMLFLVQRPVRLHEEGTADKPLRYNLVGERQIANNDLAFMIATFMESPVTIRYQPFNEARPGHDRHYGLDGKLLRSTGWRAPVPFEVSMRDTVEWQQKHPEWLEPKADR